MGGSRGSSTTVVKRLPEYATSYVVAFLNRAYDYSTEAYVPYWDSPTGSPYTHAAQPLNETDAIALLASRGRSGNPTILKGAALVEDVVSGGQLPGTDDEFQGALVKFHDALVDAVENDLIPLLGGGLYYVGDLSAENLAQELCVDFASDQSAQTQKQMKAKNYKRARTDQLRFLSMGVEYAAQPYIDADILRTAGLHQRQYNQEELADLYNRWWDEQSGPIQRLEILGNAIRAMVGTQYSKTEPIYKPSQAVTMVSSGVSMAIAGSMIGSSVAQGATWGSGGGPYGMAAGAVIGLVLGALASS